MPPSTSPPSYVVLAHIYFSVLASTSIKHDKWSQTWVCTLLHILPRVVISISIIISHSKRKKKHKTYTNNFLPLFLMFIEVILLSCCCCALNIFLFYVNSLKKSRDNALQFPQYVTLIKSQFLHVHKVWAQRVVNTDFNWHLIIFFFCKFDTHKLSLGLTYDIDHNFPINSWRKDKSVTG